MIRSLFLICLLSFNLSAENSEKALQDSLLKFWEARNARDFALVEKDCFKITGVSCFPKF
jgi:hypothetical protein